MVQTGMDERADAIRKSDLVGTDGVAYNHFRRTLKPRLWLVWVHLLSGHLALITLVAAVPVVGLLAPGWEWLAAAAVAPLLGYMLAYIMLFYHEAAHYLIAPTRRSNDLLADIAIGSLFGQSIDRYRVVHFDHHRLLGQPEDSEHSYFDPLNLRFIVESLIGIRLLKVASDRARRLRERDDEPTDDAARPRRGPRWPMVVALVVNGGIVLGSAALGQPAISAAWVAGMIIFFPFFASVRQVLEHRDDMADPRVDYSKTAHGAITRIFGDGPISSTLGAAGFNRHLLHHIEPQVSYTRLKEMERFLMDTELAPYLQDRRSTYYRTFCRLMHVG